MRECLGHFLERLSQILCFTGLERFSGKIRRQFQAKSTEKSAEKSAEKPKNPPENPPKNPPENPRKFRLEICRKLHNKIRHRDTHLPADVIVSALQLVGATSLVPPLWLVFWMFNRQQTSTFRCKIHSKIRQRDSP